MAAVDSLLRLITVRNAEVLVITTGEVPVLRKSGEAAPLSMPALDAALVATFVHDLLDATARARLATTGTADVTYRTDDGSWFAVVIEARASGHRLTCRVASAPLAPAPARATSPSLLSLPALASASDLFLSTAHPPRIRVGDQLLELDPMPTTADQIASLCDLTDAHRRTLDSDGSVDVAIATPSRRYRANVFRHHTGLAATLRPIRTSAPTLDELHLPTHLHDLARFTSGLVLVTGRAGSGKSTTLSALLAQLNATCARHVITLEDPIEHEYTPDRCLIHQREVGRDVPDFATGLRAALRESPDVILLGEMRDRATIAAALTAAETGHLVLSTLHCAGAAGAVDRIVDVFPEAQQGQIRLQLAGSLRAVLAQTLVPAAAGTGRYPAHELMVVTSNVAALIRESKGHQLASAIQTGRDAGMVPLERSLAALVRAGRVTRANARAAALDPTALDEHLR